MFNYIFSPSVLCILVVSGLMDQNPVNGGLSELELALMVLRGRTAELVKYYRVWPLTNDVEMIIFHLGQ